jgi:hypothetical protein
MPLVRKSDYARSRGVTPAAVTTAIKTGRIRAAVVTQNGKELLDFDKANELWDRNTLQQPPSVKQQARAVAAASVGPISTPTNQQLQALIQGLPEDQIPELNDSRARREHYLAEKARLEAMQGRGELVPASDVKAEAFALARSVRDGMLRVPDRLAPLLAATTDARETHRLLTEEIRVALRGLADG